MYALANFNLRQQRDLASQKPAKQKMARNKEKKEDAAATSSELAVENVIDTASGGQPAEESVVRRSKRNRR